MAPTCLDLPVTDQLFREVYAQLHRLATQRMRGQPAGHTLQPTALVNEAYLRIQGAGDGPTERDHFVRLAARAMRQILVDHARRRSAGHRPPAERRMAVEVDALFEAFDSRAQGLPALDAALERLEQVDPHLARLVELHFFGGQPLAECARLLETSERNVYRWWRSARAFLQRELQDEFGGRAG